MVQVAFRVELATLWPDRESQITEDPDKDGYRMVPRDRGREGGDIKYRIHLSRPELLLRAKFGSMVLL